MSDDEQIDLAKLAYQAYGQQRNFKNYQGDQMPEWDELGSGIQDGWIAAAGAVAGFLQGPTASD